MPSFSGLKPAPCRIFLFHENSWFWFKCQSLTSLAAPTQHVAALCKAVSTFLHMCPWSLLPALPRYPASCPVRLTSAFAPRTFAPSRDSHLPGRTGAPDAHSGFGQVTAPQGCLSQLGHVKQSGGNHFTSCFNYSYFRLVFF